MRSNSALTAQAIRRELKELFPEVKFQVLSRGHDCVTVKYEDGPVTDNVNRALAKYRSGHFNSMEDIYEYDNRTEGQLSVKYVFVERSMSEAAKANLLFFVQEEYPGCRHLGYDDYCEVQQERVSTLVHREFVNREYTGKEVAHGE